MHSDGPPVVCIQTGIGVPASGLMISGHCGEVSQWKDESSSSSALQAAGTLSFRRCGSVTDRGSGSCHDLAGRIGHILRALRCGRSNHVERDRIRPAYTQCPLGVSSSGCREPGSGAVPTDTRQQAPEAVSSPAPDVMGVIWTPTPRLVGRAMLAHADGRAVSFCPFAEKTRCEWLASSV